MNSYNLKVGQIVVSIDSSNPYFEQFEQAIGYAASSIANNTSSSAAVGLQRVLLPFESVVGKDLPTGTLITYNGNVYKFIGSGTVLSNWTPDVAGSLFILVSAVDGVDDEWKPFIQPTSSSNAYMKGDKVAFENAHYVSLIDNNSWSPSAYPQGWQIQ